jgi:hypothetical protein
MNRFTEGYMSRLSEQTELSRNDRGGRTRRIVFFEEARQDARKWVLTVGVNKVRIVDVN